MYCGNFSTKKCLFALLLHLTLFHLLIVSLTNHGSNKERLDLEFWYNSIPAVGSNPRVFASRSDAYDLHRISETYSRTVRTTKTDGRIHAQRYKSKRTPGECVEDRQMLTVHATPRVSLYRSLSLSIATLSTDLESSMW